MSAVETTPVSVFFAVISTPGINAPELSDAIPLNVALMTCAPRKLCDKTTSTHTAIKITVLMDPRTSLPMVDN